MTGLPRTGAMLGATAGLGLLLMNAGVPHRRRAGLAGRLLPYLRDTPIPSRLLAQDRFAVGGACRFSWAAAVRTTTIKQQAAGTTDLSDFRAASCILGALRIFNFKYLSDRAPLSWPL